MSHKLDALVHYVCARCDNPSKLGATKLNKVLWYSDVIAYQQLGESITGATYIKRQFGPVPRDILGVRSRLANSGAVVAREGDFHGYGQTHFFALRPPDISGFTADQISLVDQVMDIICAQHTATSISARSHDLVWEIAEIGEELPMAAAAFGGQIGELDETDMAWARSEVDRIEGARSAA